MQCRGVVSCLVRGCLLVHHSNHYDHYHRCLGSLAMLRVSSTTSLCPSPLVPSTSWHLHCRGRQYHSEAGSSQTRSGGWRGREWGAVAVLAGLGCGLALWPFRPHTTYYADSSSSLSPPQSPPSPSDALCSLVKRGDAAEVKKRLERDPDEANRRHSLGWLPLQVAAIHGDAKMVALLLSYGANPDAEDAYSPKELAARRGGDVYPVFRSRHLHFSSTLRPEVPTVGFTALHYAILSGNDECVRALLNGGANPTKKDPKGEGPLSYATDDQRRYLDPLFEEATKVYLEKKREQERELRKKYPLEQQLKSKIVGQEGAINAVAAAIRRRENGWHDEDHPLVFLFLGSSGIGKTELAKQLANYIHKDNKAGFIRMDMSEFQSKHEVAKFIGSPPGYVGFEEGGQLTEKLRQCPDAVVLLDEVEKAHPDVLTIMLQLFDEGRLTDGKGLTVECKEAIFVMTSNLAQQEIGNEGQALREEADARGGLGKDSSHDETVSLSRRFIDTVVYPILRGHFQRDEFLGRINEVLFFLPFNQEELQLIVVKELEKWAEKAMQRHSLRLTWDREVILALAGGYNVRYGARSIQHEVEKRVVNQLAKAHEMNELQPGGTAHLHVDNSGKIRVRTTSPKKEKSSWGFR